MKYRALYKCRLCGAEYYAPTYTTDQDTAASTMVHLNAGVRGANHMQPNPTGTHVCAGEHTGSLGLSDFLGWKADPGHAVPADMDDHTTSGLLED